MLAINPIRECADKLRSKLDTFVAGQVFSTSDYSIFKKCQFNRSVRKDRRGYKNLLNAIKENNLLDAHPIKVNPDMEVLDGQHRLEVAKELGVPIYYSITHTMGIDDIADVNCTMLKWSNEDYTDFWITKGNQNYVLFKEFVENYDLPLDVALYACSLGMEESLRRAQLQFKKGKFVFPVSTNKDILYLIMQQYEKIISLIKEKSIQMPVFLRASSFKLGILRFLLALEEEDGFDGFMKNLEMKVGTLHHGTGSNDYKRQFINIYNFRRHYRIAE